MFKPRFKTISTSLALALILGTGPIACSGAPPVTSDSPRQYSVQKRSGDYTISAVDQSQLANLDGIKLLNGKGPSRGSETKFDVAVEVQGLGLQFDKDRTYGYMRADRTFTSERSVGIRFRLQF
ncbi:MAG: hypothetical protein O3C34_14860 [Proteobacteria bacterium]|nr:hypothetical protein [Pseudomonadota bacterium]